MNSIINPPPNLLPQGREKRWPVLSTLLVLCFCFLSFSSHADDTAKRLDLARKMQDLRPASAQINNAVEQYVEGLPEEERAAARAGIQTALNYEAIEKISIDAYAQVFTVEELEAMIAYYNRPESRSAEEKAGDYAKIVYPEIVRMLDTAMMKAKTGN